MFVGVLCIVVDNTMQRARVLAVFVHEQFQPNAHSRVCRKAGATVRLNPKLRDMNINVPATDDRAIEVFASGLDMFNGAKLAMDITVRSAIVNNINTVTNRK